MKERHESRVAFSGKLSLLCITMYFGHERKENMLILWPSKDNHHKSQCVLIDLILQVTSSCVKCGQEGEHKKANERTRDRADRLALGGKQYLTKQLAVC